MGHRLVLLGEPVIQTFDGSPVEFPVGKPLALLCFLTLEGRPVSRDELAGLLWPTSPPPRARHSVRQAIWMIRRELGEGAIEGDDPVRSTLSSDGDGFREAIANGNLEEARGLWNGPLLRGLNLPDCREWDRWKEERQEVLSVGFFRALLDKTVSLTEDGKAEEALDLLAEAIELNPFSLEARILLVETLLALRRFPAARQALEDAKRGGDVSADGIERLARLEGRLTEALEKEAGTNPGRMGESRHFVGRAGELLDLIGLWKRVRTGYSGSACIVGPTGIGKTRLATEFLAGVEEEGGRVARTKGYRGEHRIPLGTVTDLVRQLMPLPGAKGIGSGSEAVLRSVLPSLRGNARGPEAGGEDAAFAHVHPAALADAVSDLVEAVAFEVPVIVFVDDWQWIDRESRALLGKVARRVRGPPCLFLFSERPQQRRQWVETAEALVRDLGGRLITLGPLKEGELLELIANLVELTDPGRAGDLAARIHGVTGGNPLFVAEVMRKLADEGASHLKRGHWVLDVDGVPESLDLPESVQELVRERLESLSATGTRIVATLAAERRSVPARLLRRRTGLDAAAFNQAVQGLVDQEVVTWTEAKHLDFTHDQLREAAGRFFRMGTERWLVGWASERPGLVSLGILGILASLAFLISSGRERSLCWEIPCWR